MAPIVILTYNRPRHVERLLQSLVRNAEAGDTDVYVFSDGARSSEDEAAVMEVRKVVRRASGFRQITVVERAENWGLARNVISGVTQVVNQYGRVIVLEDDLVASPYLLRFMNEALNVYADEPRVGHIHACEYTSNATLPPTFLIRFTGSWGWATWQSAWTHFCADGSELLRRLHEQGLEHDFDLGGSYPFTRMLRRQVEGKNNSWAIRWNASLFLDGLLSLNAGRSLVINGGLDGSGTNSLADDPYASELWMEPLPVERIEPIEENAVARQALARHYRRTNSLWARGLRRLRRMIN